MQAALLVLTLTMASLAVSVGARAEFNCFQTPGEGIRCACIGASDCSEMRNSGSCKSEAECDKGELGAIVCSCKAARTPNSVVGGQCYFAELCPDASVLHWDRKDPC
jgi:hypothetical protein